MDSNKIEEILNEGFPAEEPEGMRERILSKASNELRSPRSNWWPKVKLAFAGAALLLIISANVYDRAREPRIAGISTSGHQVTTEHMTRVLAESRKLTYEMIAWMGSDATSPRMRQQL